MNTLRRTIEGFTRSLTTKLFLALDILVKYGSPATVKGVRLWSLSQTDHRRRPSDTQNLAWQMLQAIQNDHRKPLPVTLERSRSGVHDKNLSTPVRERDGIFLFFSN